MATLFDYTNQAWTVDGVYVDCWRRLMHHRPARKSLSEGAQATLKGNDKMRLETTITDQILLTFGDGPNRSVLKVWHISERDAAELYLANLRKGE